MPLSRIQTHFLLSFSKSTIVRIGLWERYHDLLVAHESQLGLEWALSRLELISQLAKAADGEQSFFLIPAPLPSSVLCAQLRTVAGFCNPTVPSGPRGLRGKKLGCARWKWKL